MKRLRTTGLSLAMVLLAAPTWASSHREAPGIAGDPAADNTDVYAFVSPNAPTTVTLIANIYPFEEPNGGPNFFRFADTAFYDIKIDNDGDSDADIVYRFDFDTTVLNGNTFLYNTGPITSLNDPDFNIRQSYSVTRTVGVSSTVLGSAFPTPPVNIGPVSTPDYANLSLTAIQTLGDGTRIFAGQRDDPFFVDLGAIFDLLTIRPGPPGHLGGGRDGLGGFNCQTIAIQVPISLLTRDGSTPSDPASAAAVIGVWATVSRPQTRMLRTDGQEPDFTGAPVQVSRLGMPLVNEVVIPLSDKDKWNGSEPSGDGQFLPYVINPELAGLLNLLYGINVPPPPRNDLVAVFLTGVSGLNQPPGVVASEQMRLNVAIQPSSPEDPLGVIGGDLAGFPNGRRIKDDIVDIELRVVAGVLVPGFNIAPNNQLGDGVNVNDLPCLATFPYLPTPHQGFLHPHHREEPRTTVPILLSAFSAAIEGDEIALEWTTTEESGSVGFRVERNSELLTPEPIPATGAGHSYRFVDRPAAEGLQRYTLLEVTREGDLVLLATREIEYRPTLGRPSLELAQNFPNPVLGSTRIKFRIPDVGDARLSFFDATGRLVNATSLKALTPGSHEHDVDTAGWPAGVYFYRLEAGDAVLSRAMRVVR